MNSKLNSKAQIKMEMLELKNYLGSIKSLINSNKCLSKILVQKDLTNLDNFDSDLETKITTDRTSTSLRLSKEIIGRYVWSILHSMASAYPLKANQKIQRAMKEFIENM